MTERWLVRKYKRKSAKLAKKRDLLAGKLLFWLAKRGGSGFLTRTAQAVLRRYVPERRFLRLESYGDVGRSVAVMAQATEYCSVAPKSGSGVHNQHCGIFPKIHARVYKNSIVSGQASAIISGGRLSVPALYVAQPQMLITDQHLLLKQMDGIGEILIPKAHKIDLGIGVFGAGSKNWYHWLIEILPAAYLSEGLPKTFDKFPLLVPDHVLQLPTFRDALMVFSGGRDLRALRTDAPTIVSELVFIDPPVSGPMNLREGLWPKPSDYSQNADVILKYRAAFLERLGLKEHEPVRRLFLARSNALRSYNQDDLIVVAERYGFEAVFPERMTFREQVETYLGAEFIIGPSGAAFANGLFCQQGTQALTWILPQYKGFCAYSNLAQIVGMELQYLFVEPTSEIKSSFDAYSASYLLDVGAFERKLDRMLKSSALHPGTHHSIPPQA